MEDQTTGQSRKVFPLWPGKGKRSIVFNLIGALVGAITLSASLAYFGALAWTNRVLENENKQQWMAMSRLIGTSIRDSMATSDAQRVNSDIRPILDTYPQIAGLWIFTPNGKILFSNLPKKDWNSLSFSEVKSALTEGRRTEVLSGNSFRQKGQNIYVHRIPLGAEDYYRFYGADIRLENSQKEPKRKKGRDQSIGYIALAGQIRHPLFRERSRRAILVGQSLTASLRPMVANFEFGEVKNLLAETRAANSDLLEVFILDNDGRVLIHPDSKEEGKVLTDPQTKGALGVNSQKPSLMQDLRVKKVGRVLDFSYQLEMDGERLGVLRLKFSLADLEKQLFQQTFLAIGFWFLFVSVGVAAGWVMMIRVVKPVRHLSELAKQVARGNFSVRADVQSGGFEMRELGRAFNNMFKGLEELSMAAALQQDLIANPLEEHGPYRVSTRFLPATQLSGDMMHLYPLFGNKLAMACGDISGTGAKSAMLMMQLSTLLEESLRFETSPSQICNYLNSRMQRSFDRNGLYATLMLAIMDPEERTVSYTPAGHPPPLYYDPRVGKWVELPGDGMPLGLEEQADLSTYQKEFHEGCLLICYTDGLTDVENENGRMMGLGPVLECLNEGPVTDPEVALSKLENLLLSFKGKAELYDDVALMAAHYGKK